MRLQVLARPSCLVPDLVMKKSPSHSVNRESSSLESLMLIRAELVKTSDCNAKIYGEHLLVSEEARSAH